MKHLDCTGHRVSVPYVLIVVVGLQLQRNCVMHTFGRVTTRSLKEVFAALCT